MVPMYNKPYGYIGHCGGIADEHSLFFLSSIVFFRLLFFLSKIFNPHVLWQTIMIINEHYENEYMNTMV